MSKRLVVAAAGVLLTGVTAPVHAASEDFCKAYAHAAVHQFDVAVHHHRCDRAIRENTSRWDSDYRHHFDWCRGVSREDADREADARRDTLRDCA